MSGQRAVYPPSAYSTVPVLNVASSARNAIAAAAGRLDADAVDAHAWRQLGGQAHRQPEQARLRRGVGEAALLVDYRSAPGSTEAETLRLVWKRISADERKPFLRLFGSRRVKRGAAKVR